MDIAAQFKLNDFTFGAIKVIFLLVKRFDVQFFSFKYLIHWFWALWNKKQAEKCNSFDNQSFQRLVKQSDQQDFDTGSQLQCFFPCIKYVGNWNIFTFLLIV